MKKKYTFVILVVIMALFTNMTALAATTSKIKVIVDNKIVKYDASPYLKNGEVMIPVKQTAEALGGKVEWDKKSNTAWINLDMMHIELIVGKSEFYIHRDADFSGIPQTIKLNTPIKSIRGSVFVPGKKVFESMGMKITWDIKKKVLSITSENFTKAINYTELSKEDILNKKEVYSWYNKNYTKAGIHYIKQDGAIYVLVSAGSKPTGGYVIGINKISYETSSKAYVSAYLKAPSTDMMVIQMETFPHVLIKLEGQRKLRSVSGEIQQIITDPLPTKVPYEEITNDDIKDNCTLWNWYNKNNQKQGISYIRDNNYIYALIGAGERPTGGFSIILDDVFYSSYDTVTINARVTPPGDNVRVMMMITYPTTLIRIKSDTIKTVVGEVLDTKITWVTMDLSTVTKMELYSLDQVKLRDITGNEKDQIMQSFNDATIDQNSYIKMIAGNVLKVTTNNGYLITFTSYGSGTNVIANLEKDGVSKTFHLIAPTIAKILLQN
ncbi:MAG: hypothetical protein K0S01_2333 [Herbinix sp.]|jgi:hypothetical protein|nr:hypothetical protein [Herbinix sp.]